jgi:signal peptidase I
VGYSLPDIPVIRIKNTWLWAGILGWMAIIYIIIYLLLPRLLVSSSIVYLTQSLVWLSLAFISYLLWCWLPGEKPQLQRGLFLLSIGIGITQVTVSVLVGLLFGFGSSPYAHNFFGLLQNGFYLASFLIGMEMARATLLASSKKWPLINMILVSLLMLLLQEPYYRFMSLSGGPETIRFLGDEILPGFSSNFLASFLAMLGGPLAAISYRAILFAFEWGSPILPNINWAITALIGTLVPITGLFYIQKTYFSPASTGQSQTHSGKSSTLPWIIVLLVAVFAIWFNTGAFGVRPFLISGYSMKPTFVLGDIVIVQPVKTPDIRVGDIIRYTRDNISIVHRVLQIQNANGELVFITRGDNNNVEDSPVPETLVDGKVVGMIPKIGWVSIGLKQVVGWVH